LGIAKNDQERMKGELAIQNADLQKEIEMSKARLEVEKGEV
jgi:hypothetical protein